MKKLRKIISKDNLLILVLSIVVCELAGVAGSIVTMPAIAGWYSMIAKPFFTPPSWLFAPVWIILFLLMGLSLYYVLTVKHTKDTLLGVTLFGTQLLLNILWSLIFFGVHSTFFAFVEIIILLITIILTIDVFWRINKTSAYLLIPYAVWVGIASILTYSIWVLNA